MEESPKVFQVDQDTLNLLTMRRQEYRIAAVAWKKASNPEQAIQYVKLVKQFDAVIAEVTAGNAVDLSDMPGSPTLPEAALSMPSTSEKEETETQQAPCIEESPRKFYFSHEILVFSYFA